MSQLGTVLIGRNEGERLSCCLDSVVGRGYNVVYVDSGSTDGSVDRAICLGVEVVELDLSRPFTAARARNAGFARLEEIDPDVRFVQFVDGDCEVVEGWLERARRELEDRPEVAGVCGRCRERFRDRSIYNRLADLEFDTPVGETKAFGGNAMVRAVAFRQVGGFNPAVIAGEEPELCVRLRQRGWTVLRIDAEMVLHDMAMTRFWQWWRRCIRNGFAFAEGAALYGRSPERHWVHQVRSIVFWGIALPLIILGLTWPTRGASLGLLGGYFLLYWRIRRYGLHCGWSAPDARLYARWCILSKAPMTVGLILYWFRRAARRPKQIIEYKGAGSSAPQRDVGSRVCDGNC
ncbi:MAG: glycosyltransferase [Isosphaerales bacterium]